MVEPKKSSMKEDSGTFWDEPLDRYQAGAININLYNNVVGFNAGDTISGTIDIVIVEPFPASELTLEFKGIERSHLSAKRVLKPLDYHRETKEIISMKSVVATYNTGEFLQAGHFTYSFNVYLPPWLPESVELKTKLDKFFTEYTLRAQFTPTDAKFYVHDSNLKNKFQNVSLFRGSRKVFISQPPQEIPQKNY